MNLIAETLITIANTLFLIALIPNARTLLINRHKLKGISYIGSGSTFIGLFLIESALFIEGSYVPFIMGILNVVYWGCSAYFSFKCRK